MSPRHYRDFLRRVASGVARRVRITNALGPFAPTALANLKLLFAIEPSKLLQVHHDALPFQHDVDAPVAKPAAFACHLLHGFTQGDVIGARSHVTNTTTNRSPVSICFTSFRALHEPSPPSVGCGVTDRPKDRLEYFVNAKIIGSRINARAWELLLAMVFMEASFGMPGLISAPIYYAYLKGELASRGYI